MFSDPIYELFSGSRENGDHVQQIECYIRVRAEGADGTEIEETKRAAYVHFGRDFDWDKWDLSGMYHADEYEESFPVPDVPGATGEVRTSKEGGGAAVIACGDAFIATSISPKGKMRGDLKGNLVNLALSITPWACNGEPIPGLNTPLAPATTDPTETPGTETS
ncbi:hypothetical protein [Actinomyces slackii]|nr:hypothetical protein [Actinomyces slackii]